MAESYPRPGSPEARAKLTGELGDHPFQFITEPLGKAYDLWLESGLGILNPNNPAYQAMKYAEDWEKNNPNMPPGLLLDDPAYMSLMKGSVQMIDPSGIGGFAGKIAKTAAKALTKAPAIQATRQYKDPTGLLDLKKLETDYPDIPQTREPLFVPKKKQVPDELKVFKSKKQQNKLMDWFDEGIKTGGMAWYNTNPLRKFAIDEYGEEVGLPLYERFLRYVAALSPNTAPSANIKQASYFNTLDQAGVPLGAMQEGTLSIPAGYGRMSMVGVKNTLASAQNPTKGPVLDPKGVDIKTTAIPLYAKETYQGTFPASAPKVGRFYENLRGNIEEMATLDAGAMRSMAGKELPSGLLRPSAGKEIYNTMETAFNKFAKKLGVTPAQTQAAIWSGSAPYTGVGKVSPGLPHGASFMETLMQRVQQTANDLQMSPKAVLSGVLRGDQYLKGLVMPTALGAGSAAGLLSQEESP